MTEQLVSNYFRVDGADSETGAETFLVLRAKSKPHAERLARRQGLLISSVRVAKKGDWEDAPGRATSAPPVELASATTEKDGDVELEHKPLTASAPLEKLPPPGGLAGAVRRRAGAGGPAPVMLSCVGGALVVGGVLALALALWPDDGVRNELQQIDFRLHELSQAVLGGTLVVAGMIVFFATAVMYGGGGRE